MALRVGRFLVPAYDSLVDGTVKNTTSNAAQTFRKNDHSKPTKDEDSKLGRHLSCQYRAFKNEDSNPAQQNSLPACVLRELAEKSITEAH